MKNPTSKQFKKVIKNFDKILPVAELAEVHMHSCNIPANSKDICDTPMCHGGWYAVANKEFNEKHTYKDFYTGAFLMAEHLGFKSCSDLEDWAEDNPQLWGNTKGLDMFNSKDAFLPSEYQKPSTKLTLEDIRNWWVDVHNRTCPRAKPLEHI